MEISTCVLPVLPPHGSPIEHGVPDDWAAEITNGLRGAWRLCSGFLRYHAAYKRLHDKQLVPLASGEHEPDEQSFLDLIGSGGVDYVQMDVCCQGGFEMARRIFEATEKQGIRFASSGGSGSSTQTGL